MHCVSRTADLRPRHESVSSSDTIHARFGPRPDPNISGPSDISLHDNDDRGLLGSIMPHLPFLSVCYDPR